MASPLVRNMLTEQRRRLVGSIMQYLEANVYPGLSEPERQALRQKVLASVSQYHDVCLDLLKSSVNDGSLLNETALEAIAAVHRDVRALRNS